MDKEFNDIIEDIKKLSRKCAIRECIGLLTELLLKEDENETDRA